ncbi:MAG: cytochrome c [Proteobacteria bacterium]|nr:cytochrome c [Pseudomonadota bacterium]
MSTASWKALVAAIAFYGPLSIGCWEQMDDGDWFPLMKRQEAVQAFERNPLLPDHPHGLSPPEGTVPVGWGATPDVAALSFPEQEAIRNPGQPTLQSLKNGERLYARYCVTCHGPQGAGDGPVAGAPFGKGPFGLVLPIGGPMSVARNLTDGHIYTTISIGRGRMPNYNRIPPEWRWDVVNYIRELNGRGGGS